MEIDNIYISTTFAPDNTELIDSLIQCKNSGINRVELGSNHCFEENYDYINDFSFQYLLHNYFPFLNKKHCRIILNI